MFIHLLLQHVTKDQYMHDCTVNMQLDYCQQPVTLQNAASLPQPEMAENSLTYSLV